MSLEADSPQFSHNPLTGKRDCPDTMRLMAFLVEDRQQKALDAISRYLHIDNSEK